MKKIMRVAFLLLCCIQAISAIEIKINQIDTTKNISIEQLIEIEQKLESEDPTFRFGFLNDHDVSFFLAAQQKRPKSFIWIDLINMHFAGERYKARQIENENERITLYDNALNYLTKSLKVLEKVNISDSSDSLKSAYNHYHGILNESIAFAAMSAGEFEKAKQMAEEMLTNNIDTTSWNYNNIIHYANTILGRVEIKMNDIKKAKEHLIKSAEVSGSPQLNSFGPSFVLARELLELGEKEIVLNYLDLVAKFWANPQNLKKWKDEIYSGKIPEDLKWK